jgi:transposase
VRALVRDDEVCRRFMSIPGVGPLTALVYKSAIDDPKRFAKSANVGVHLGLTPRKYASGEIDYNGRITKCGDPLTRSHLFEAAMVLMRRSAKTSSSGESTNFRFPVAASRLPDVPRGPWSHDRVR